MRSDVWLPVAFLASALLTGSARAADPPRTVDLFQRHAGSIAERVCASLPSHDVAGVTIAVLPAGSSWYLEQPIFDALRRSGLVPSADSAARFSAEFGVNDIRVEYRNQRRTWFLGSSVVDRVVHLEMWSKLRDRECGTLLVAAAFADSSIDTVAVADLERLESPGIPATRASLPPAGFFSSVLEPAVFLGSVAVAIYLLFSVRS